MANRTIATLMRSRFHAGPTARHLLLPPHMRAIDTLNSQPGSVPDVWTRGNAITCRVDIATMQGNAHLLLKSDATGNLWASIENPYPRSRERRE